MATLGEYLQTWKLKLSTTKAVLAVYLNKNEAKHELKVNYNSEILPFCSEPAYLVLILDRTLTTPIPRIPSRFIPGSFNSLVLVHLTP